MLEENVPENSKLSTRTGLQIIYELMEACWRGRSFLNLPKNMVFCGLFLQAIFRDGTLFH